MIEILATCNSTLGNCCTNYALAGVLDVVSKILVVVQIAVPILLIIGATIDLIKLMSNPESKKGTKPLINKFLSAAIVFFVPTIMNAILGMLPDSFEVSQCFKEASISQDVLRAQPHKYYDISDKKRQNFLYSPDDYEKPKNDGGSSSVTGTGAQRLINVALGELGNSESGGNHHKYEAYNGLDDSQPWCAAFVSWCAGQAGYLDQGIFPKFVGCSDGLNRFPGMGGVVNYGSSSYTPKGGDIVFFDWGDGGMLDHVGIVISADGDSVYTIEGNTSCEGDAARSCAGYDGVSKKVRPRHNGTIYAFVTPKYPG